MRQTASQIGVSHEALTIEGVLQEQFAALVLNPTLRPVQMTKEALPFFSPLVMRQWLKFAQKLAHQPNPSEMLKEILKKND